MIDSPVRASLDFDAPGRQVGQLQIPRSSNESGWSSLYVPVICLKNGNGPTVLVLGGNHGDEPEGPIAALKLARDTRLADVRGRLIVIPCLSPEAARAFTRLWPSGANFNRAFPGSPDGSTDQQLADYLTRVLIPMSDLVCDIHSGGRSMLALPWSEMHLVEDREQRRRMVEAMLAWNTDYHFVYIDVAGGGLLVGEAERQGKMTIGTELGGGGHCTAAIHRLAMAGLTNMLRWHGVLAGEVETRESLGKPPAVILEALDPDDYLLAPESGLLEILVDVGERVEAGQAVAQIHFLERPDRAPVGVVARTSGLVCTVRAIAPTQQGDCVVVIGQIGDRESLLDGEV
ncbi:MAG: succinylglutamate desuccinylase/aspartoacylase family protein [Chloroflexota bacterium]